MTRLLRLLTTPGAGPITRAREWLFAPYRRAAAAFWDGVEAADTQLAGRHGDVDEEERRG